jgi:epsilon-lactone hydrolase
VASRQAEEMHDDLRALRARMGAHRPTLEESRAHGERFGSMTVEPAGLGYQPVDVDGVPGLWIAPEDATAAGVILYLHGGGYTVCSARSHRRLAGHLSLAVGAASLVLDYRLAPEHPYPVAVEDTRQAYRWLLGRGFAPAQVAFAGDAAGAGLAVLALLRLRALGAPMPAACALLSPWVDLDLEGATMTTNADRDLLVSAGLLQAAAARFLAGHDRTDPAVAPLRADLTGLPPVSIQVGACEVLLDDASRLAARLTEAGVETGVEVFDGMQHVFQVGAGRVPEADEALGRLGRFLADRLAPRSVAAASRP